MTLVAFLQRMVPQARALAVVLAVAVCLRFSFVAVRTSFADPVFASPAPPASSSSRPSASREPVSALQPPTARAADDKPRRITLVVTVAAPRSEVFVNGRSVGKTPFLGDVSCKGGRELRIEVVPASGPLMRFVRHCQGKNVIIARPDEPRDETPSRSADGNASRPTAQ